MSGKKSDSERRFNAFFILFNEERFFEAHEELELVWRAAHHPEKDFYQGLIQTAAALVHVQRNNLEGAERLHKSAARYLSPFLPARDGVEIQTLLDETWSCITRKAPYPKVRLQKGC